MRILGGVPVLLGLLWGCGSAGQESGKLSSPDGECLTCNDSLDDEHHDEVTIVPHVAVEPKELLFYGELSSGRQMPPEPAVVHNRTNKPVALTQAYVADNLSTVYGDGSASYFSVTGLDQPTVLMPGESLTLWVNFAATTEQRSAVLVIESNDVEAGGLFVELSGKYFSGTTGF